MTRKRGADFRLLEAARDPGFMPRRADIGGLLDALAEADGDDAVHIERALERLGADAAAAAIDRTTSGDARARDAAIASRLTRLVGHIAAQGGARPEHVAFLVTELGATDARVRSAAANALGRLPSAAPEAALIEALERETVESARRALAATAQTKAELMIARTVGRGVASRFRVERRPREPTPIVVGCRRGLEPLLVEELGADLAPRAARDRFGAGRVEATLVGAPERLLAARTMLGFGFPLPIERCASLDPERVGEALTRALVGDAAHAVLTYFTDGPIRYRIAWAGGGKRRAIVWRVADAVKRERPELVNDPTRATWEAVVRERRAPAGVRVELAPHFADDRFAYRKGDVPGASHPTIAAGLVRLARARPDDVVWDPFVGSGLELCERAIAGPYRKLLGSDRDPRAPAVARDNLAAALAADAELVQADARSFVPPERPTLILTNPPMGRRVVRSAELGPLLDAFLAHAARVLAPGGRIAWIAPQPARTNAALKRAKLRIARELVIDLGGFDAAMQLLVAQ